MIHGNYLSSMDDLARVLDLRAQIFADARDRYDDMAFYALVFDGSGAPAGIGRLYIDEDDHFTVGRVGVLPQHRGGGLGDLIMRMLLQRALDLNAPEIRLKTPAPLTGFFARYGFHMLPDECPGADALMRATPASIDAAGGCSGQCGRA